MGKRFIATVAFGLVAIAGCGGTSPSGGSSGSKIEVKIAAPLDLTGATAYVGVEQGNATALAVDDINSTSKKVHMTATQKDVRSTVADATSVVQSFVADPGYSAFAGIAFTQEGQAVTPILQGDGRPAIFLQVTQIPNRPPNVFSMAAPRTKPTQQLVDKGLKAANVKTIGIVYQDQATLNTDVANIKSMATAGGMSVVDVEGSTLAETAFDTQVTKVLAANPDAVGIFALAPQTATVLTKLRARGFKGLTFGQPGALNPAMFKAAGPAAEGFESFTFWDPGVANAEAKRFLSLYSKKYPDQPPPDSYALQAWDALHILDQVVEKIGSTDKAKIAKELQTETFSGATQDKMSFNSDGFILLDGLAVKAHADGTTTVLK